MTNDTIEKYMSDSAVEYAENHIGEDVQVGAMAKPPIPREKVREYTDDEWDNPLRAHLYDLTDIALAINHSGDPMLDHSTEEHPEPYTITDESVSEIKIARGALFSVYNRELVACAKRLDIDPDEHEDLVRAIRDELGYSMNVEVDREYTELDDE